MAERELSQSRIPRNPGNGRFGKSPNLEIAIGRKFQKLTTIEKPFVQGKHTVVHCKCECGGIRLCRVPELLNGRAIGCVACPKIVSDERRKATGDRTRTHGMCRTPEYNLWCGMRARCVDPKNLSYLDYGGRGISVCDRWMNSFEDFLEDVGMRPSKEHSMDRIDFNGNYEPSNCRWATGLDQARNKRNTFMVLFKGRMMGTTEIAKELGVSREYAWRKLKKHGVSIEQFEVLAEINRARTWKGSKCSTPPERFAWRSMKRRCENPKDVAYTEYGGRGITVSRGWSESYETFFLDMGPRPDGHSLDRIDNNKGYSKENCRWATSEVQNRNRRNNKLHEFRGEMLTKGEIAKALGLADSTISRYIERGGLTADDIEKRASSPLARRKKTM